MILVTADVPEGSSLEQEVDEDIKAFERWFCANIDTSAACLTRAEIAIIKSYLYQKTHPSEVSGGQEEGSGDPM